MQNKALKIGIDLGGTKISAIVMSEDNRIQNQIRIPSPQGNYNDTVKALIQVVNDLEQSLSHKAQVGIGLPGSISPKTGMIQNANSTWLNGKPLNQDLMQALDREIRFANDANCFALSESTDGAAAGKKNVFGVIIGTGCGGGLVIDQKIVTGPKGISGEWGHTPLPWPEVSEVNATRCWCGLNGCLETWVSGTALGNDHERVTGEKLTAKEVVERALNNDPEATQTLQRHTSRLARGLSAIVNIVDPDVIVLGGGLSNVSSLYKKLPKVMKPYIFSDDKEVVIKPPLYGDDSGVRGAAWLWNS